MWFGEQDNTGDKFPHARLAFKPLLQSYSRYKPKHRHLGEKFQASNTLKCFLFSEFSYKIQPCLQLIFSMCFPHLEILNRFLFKTDRQSEILSPP